MHATQDGVPKISRKYLTGYTRSMREYRIAIGATIFAAVLIVAGVYTLAHTSTITSEAVVQPPPFVPERIATTSEPVLSAEAYLVVHAGVSGIHTTLAQKNEHVALPIASITKLMTAYAASELLMESDVSIPTEALTGKGRTGWYKDSMRFGTYAAYAGMLVASHNELAEAFAIASSGTISAFVERMNIYANLLGLRETVYVNPSGLDPYQRASPVNQSSAHDIYVLLERIQKQKPVLFEITGMREFSLLDTVSATTTVAYATNVLLGERLGVFRVVGGKTGETPRAKQALATAAEAPCGGMVYVVVLRSDDRFADTRALLQYASEAFDWVCPLPPPEQK